MTKSNPIVWCEIYVQNMDRAKSFYESVFQMKLEKLESLGMDMWAFPMAMDQVGASGALVKMEGVKSGGSGTIPYFHCDEVATELERVVAAGGQIQQPKTSIGQYGFMALIVDTEGNMIGLHMPPNEILNTTQVGQND
jgi:predicted enzyme related to lactoylglutathione lyase